MMQHNRQLRRRRRQRHPLVTAAGAAVAAYGTYRLAKFAWDTYWQVEDDIGNGEEERNGDQEETAILFENNLCVGDDVKRMRMQRCKVEASKALMDFLPSLKVCIENLECANFSECVRDLKAIRRRKKEVKDSDDSNGDDSIDGERERERELWDIIKVRSMTKHMCACYSFTIMFLLLNVQVHLLGGQNVRNRVMKKRDEENECDFHALNDNNDPIARIHHRVLKRTYDYFFKNGVPLLANDIEKALSKNISDLDMRSVTGISKELFENTVKNARRDFELREGVLQYIIQDEDNLESDDSVVQYILDETWDIIESISFMTALNECMDILFHLAHENLTIFDKKSTNSEYQEPSLAQIVAQLKQVFSTFFSKDDAKSSYIDKLILLPKVHQLGISSFDI